MSGAEEAAALQEWQRQVMARAFEVQAAREAVEDRAEEEARRARVEDRRDHDFEAFRSGMTGEPPRTLGAVLHDLASVPDGPWWDPGAPLGSERNPQPLFGDPAPVERSRESDIDRLLARAKAVDTPYMRDQVRRYHERGAYGREISR